MQMQTKEAEFGGMRPQAKECQTLSAATTSWEEARKERPLEASEGVWPCQPSFWTSRIQDTERIRFGCPKPLLLWHLIRAWSLSSVQDIAMTFNAPFNLPSKISSSQNPPQYSPA